MPIIRVSKQVWKLVMLEAIETDESASIVMDRLLAEAIENGGKNSRTAKGGDKKGSSKRDKKYVAGVIGLVE